LPVGPALGISLADFKDLSNLPGAVIRVHASSELGDEHRKSKSFGIIISLAESFFMPLHADVIASGNGLIVFVANVMVELAAVGVGVHGLIWGAILGTWRLVEANGPNE
jgi:hypothetical protein